MRRLLTPCSLLALVALLTSCAAREAADTNPAPRLDDHDAWIAHVLPSQDDVAFEEIAWNDGFAKGLAKAQTEGRPFLFYAMNGHPLGCT